MARMASASDIKKGKTNKSSAPKEGTKIRRVYDELRSGSIVNVSAISKRACVQLRDMYGMEIETVRDRGRIIGSRLIGEWDGPYFVPIERII